MSDKNLQQQYLYAIGIQTWRLKSSADEFLIADKVDPVKPSPARLIANARSEKSVKTQTESISPLPSPAVENISTIEQTHDTPHSKAEPPVSPKTFNTIDTCLLCQSRKNHLQVLSGNGHADADVFFICESPTADEDREGHYLTGEIESLFNKMLDVIEISNNFFITALVKCHSFDEFLLTEEDIQNCSQHLMAQIKEFQPKVMVLLGSSTAQTILKSTDSFNQLRNKIHLVEFNNQSYQAIVSYHPAYLLRNPRYKKEALKDLILIKSLINNTN